MRRSRRASDVIFIQGCSCVSFFPFLYPSFLGRLMCTVNQREIGLPYPIPIPLVKTVSDNFIQIRPLFHFVCLHSSCNFNSKVKANTRDLVSSFNCHIREYRAKVDPAASTIIQVFLNTCGQRLESSMMSRDQHLYFLYWIK